MSKFAQHLPNWNSTQPLVHNVTNTKPCVAYTEAEVVALAEKFPGSIYFEVSA